MNGFLTRLVDRTLGLAQPVQPVLASRFAPAPSTRGADPTISEGMVTSRQVDEPASALETASSVPLIDSEHVRVTSPRGTESGQNARRTEIPSASRLRASDTRHPDRASSPEERGVSAPDLLDLSTDATPPGALPRFPGPAGDARSIETGLANRSKDGKSDSRQDPNVLPEPRRGIDGDGFDRSAALESQAWRRPELPAASDFSADMPAEDAMPTPGESSLSRGSSGPVSGDLPVEEVSFDVEGGFDWSRQIGARSSATGRLDRPTDRMTERRRTIADGLTVESSRPNADGELGGRPASGWPDRAPVARGVPEIRVTIGRVDVRASVALPPPTARPEAPTPRVSLDDYLRSRRGGTT